MTKETRETMGTSIGSERHLLSQDDDQSELQKKKIFKNLIIVSVAFLFLFTAFQALTNLQSSINTDQGLGTVGLSVIYGVLVISCMFVPAPAIDILGYKRCIAISMVCYIIYIAANFYATWVTLIPGSVVVGLGAAPLWSAKCAYLTAAGKKYAQLSGETAEAVVSRFFGTFFMIFQSSQIWGNIVASTILQVRDANYTYITPSIEVVMERCGANYCNDPMNNTNLDRPSPLKIYTLMGVYLGCSCVALFIVMCFLNNIDNREYSEDGTQDGAKAFCSGSLVVETYRHLRHTNQLLLIPLTLLTGMEQGFVGSDFTKSYISCSLGIWMVGYIMICYGITDAIFCMIFGKVVKYVGRIPVFTFGAVVHIAVLVTMLVWRVRPDYLIVLFVLAALWGMCDAVWQTQVNALYGCLFYERAGAFSNHRMWQSLGFILAFAYSSYLCTEIKIYILMAVLLIGMLGYYVVEWREYQQEDIKVPGIDFT